LTKVGKLSLKFLFYGFKFVFLEKFSTYCLRVLYIYRDLRLFVILRPWTDKIVLFIEQIKWCTENY